MRYPLYITENSICTSADSTIGTPCRGDEGEFLLRFYFREKLTNSFLGGPLVVDSPGHFLQIGVFSFQFSVGCDRGWPAVFIRVRSKLIENFKKDFKMRNFLSRHHVIWTG